MRSVGVLKAPRSVSVRSHFVASRIGVGRFHADAQVVVLLVGEVGACVAGGAADVFGEEQVAAAAGAGGQAAAAFEGRLVARIERRIVGRQLVDFVAQLLFERPHEFQVVVGCRVGHDGPLERGDGLRDGLDAHAFAGKDLVELQSIARDLPDGGDRVIERISHFDGIGDRTGGLGFERSGAAVPELGFREDAVVADRGIAGPGLAVDAAAELGVGGVALIRVVAACAADGAVGGKSRVEEELPAQFDLGPGERVRERSIGMLDLSLCCGQAGRQEGLDHAVMLRVGQPVLDLRQRQWSGARNAGCQLGGTELNAVRRFGVGDRPSLS